LKERQTHSSEFKLRIALEAIKGEKTVALISQENEIHPNLIRTWKKQLLESGKELYDQGKKQKKENDKQEKKMDELHKKIGQLTVERDFLKKKYRQIYGKEPEL